MDYTLKKKRRKNKDEAGVKPSNYIVAFLKFQAINYMKGGIACQEKN